MSNKARVLKHLQALSIPCEVYEHPAVFTMEECLALPYAAPDVTFCKNILLCNNIYCEKNYCRSKHIKSSSADCLIRLEINSGKRKKKREHSA